MDETTFLKCACSQCDGHVEYPISAVGQTVPCPHCGAMEILPAAVIPERKKRGPLVLIGLVAAVLVIALAGVLIRHQMGSRESSQAPVVPEPTSAASSTTAPGKEGSPPDATAAKSPADFKTGAIQLERKPGSGLVYAVGRLKNNSAHQRFGVKIELDLLDNLGQKVGTATDYIQVIEPRDEWTFQALINDAKAMSARLGRISEQE